MLSIKNIWFLFSLSVCSLFGQTAKLVYNNHAITLNKVAIDFKNELPNSEFILSTYSQLNAVDFANLNANGLHFKSWIEPNCYLFVTKNLDLTLQTNKPSLNSIIKNWDYLKPEWKIDATITQTDTVKLVLEPYDNEPIVGSDIYKKYASLFTVDTRRNILIYASNSGLNLDLLLTFAKSNCIARIAYGDNQTIPLNFYANNLTGASELQNKNDLNLNGSGIVIGVSDGGFALYHSDFQNRITRLTQVGGSLGEHSTHITGTIGGAGLLIEYGKGAAPKSELISDEYISVVYNTKNYYEKYGMSLANHSYTLSSLNLCTIFGTYTSDCKLMDKTINENPNVLHIVAAGNSGSISGCAATAGFGTIAYGYQNAKNVLTVGGIGNTLLVNNTSSKGPTKDGRIKPEVVARGIWTYSTTSVNTYNYLGAEGTSFSASNATGSIALLTELYKKIHSGNLPAAAYLKAIVLNSAIDIENTGPDFKSGFGALNVLLAAKEIKKQTISSSLLSALDTFTQVITVPSGVHKLKILAYWDDTVGNVAASKSLVNDLDLRVIQPNGTIVLPYILNPALPTLAATQGVDRTNNVEQVVIVNPTAGNYRFKVAATKIPFGKQRVFVSSIIDSSGLFFTAPGKSSTFRPGDGVNFQFEAKGITSGTLTLSYSLDSGATWVVISNTIAVSAKTHAWTIPLATATTSSAIFSLQSSATSQIIYNGTFTIMQVPILIFFQTCGSTVTMRWLKIAGVNKYQVVRLISGKWQVMSVTADSFFSFNNISPTERVIVALTGIKNNKLGRQMDGRTTTTSAVNCSYVNDVALTKITKPKTGRQHTLDSLSNSSVCAVSVVNNSASTITNIPIYMRLNTGAVISETIATIAANATISYTFTNTLNVATVAKYQIKVWLGHTLDPNRSNDTITDYFFNVINTPLTLPFTQNFETAADTNAFTLLPYVAGVSEMEYIGTSKNGRGSTKNGLFNCKGKRAFILDKHFDFTTSEKANLLFTYNLSTYSASDNVVLNFDWMHNGAILNATDSLFIRGKDTDPWIKVLKLKTNVPSTFKTETEIFVSKILAANSQTLSKTTQFRITYSTQYTTDVQIGGGLIIDNIHLFNAPNDAKLGKIVMPTFKCGSTSDSVKVYLFNKGTFALNNPDISYTCNNTSTITQTCFTSLAPGDSILFVFNTLPTFVPNLVNTLKIWVKEVSDGNILNDSAFINFRVVPRITTPSHLETFDLPAQTFYTYGTNSSWQLGTPNSFLANKAVTGAKAWATSLNDNYNYSETSFLQSGCYDFTSRANDIRITYHAKFDLEKDYDSVVIQYSSDLGKTWKKVGLNGGTYNGYNDVPNKVFEDVQTKWRVHGFTVNLNSLASKTNVLFRFALFSDLFVEGDGFILDNFHILPDTNRTYTGISTTKQEVGIGSLIQSNTNKNHILWVNDAASILDSTTIGVNVHTGLPRLIWQQYTLNRNFWVVPKNKTTAPYPTQLFITENEVNSLIAVDTNCKDITDLGVTNYNGKNIDADFLNDSAYCPSCLTYFPPSQVSVIPYYNGMYLAFTPNRMGEFWINTGTPTRTVPLANNWIYTNAKWLTDNAQIQWKFNTNLTLGTFHIYYCNNPNQYKTFTNLLGSVPFNSSYNTYNFTHLSPNKNSTNYYYITYQNNNVQAISNLIPLYNNIQKLAIIPNPSLGNFQIQFNTQNKKYSLYIYNSLGKIVTSIPNFISNINLQLENKGLYYVTLQSNTETITQKLVIY